MLLFGGTLTGQRNGLKGSSCRSGKGNGKSCTWGGTSLCSSVCCQAGRQLCRKGSGGPGDGKLNISNVPLKQRQPVVSWAALGGVLPAG